MQRPLFTRLRIMAVISICSASATSIRAQVPESGSVPRLAVPARGTAGTPQILAEPVATPAAETPGQPTTVTAAPPPAGVTPVAPAPPPATASSSAAATAGRSYSAAVFGLTLDGASAGVVRSVEGGAAVGNVVVAGAGPDNIAKKHIGAIVYEDLSFEVGLDTKPVMDWITSTWNGANARKSGSIQLADHGGTVRSERQFTDALLIGTTFPALDAGSKEAGVLTVTIAAESVREKAASGTIQGAGSKAQKRWIASNFRLILGDLDVSRVARIGSFTVAHKPSENAVGEMRDYEKQPGALVFPNLKVTLSEMTSASWAQWHKDFLVDGKNDDAQEKNGAIVLLDQSRSVELARVNLFGCGIYRFGTERLEAIGGKAAAVTADLYCERMEFAAAK